MKRKSKKNLKIKKDKKQKENEIEQAQIKQKKKCFLFRKKDKLSNQIDRIEEKGGNDMNKKEPKEHNSTSMKKTLLACLLFIIAIVGITIWRANMPVIEVEQVAVDGLETGDNKTVKQVTLSLTAKSGKVISYTVNLNNESIKTETTDGYFAIDGIDIVNTAASLLGTTYKYGSKNPDNGGIDCSGLIYYTLSALGVKTKGFSNNNLVPEDCIHWVTYGSDYGGTLSIYNYFNEVKYWYIDDDLTPQTGDVRRRNISIRSRFEGKSRYR